MRTTLTKIMVAKLVLRLGMIIVICQKEFAFDCADLLAKKNIKSYVFESLRPTPELSFAVRHLNCFWWYYDHSES